MKLGKLLVVAGLCLSAAFGFLLTGCGNGDEDVRLLNVSYDPTRELFRDLNAEFTPQYEKEKGVKVAVKQSHGGSGSQAQSVINGLRAHVVTMALWDDVENIARKGLIASDWEGRLPNKSLPWVSTIVFVVRKGNPKGIKDWPDLVKSGLQVITPNPKTSGNGRLSMLAAWGSVTTRGGSEADAEAFVRQLYRQVPVLDAAARAATVTFAHKNIGDVHLTWENEAHLEVEEAKGTLEIVYPPVSIRAEPPVAAVDANLKDARVKDAAEAYLKFLYTDAAQDIIARHHYRPTNDAIRKKHATKLPDLTLFPVTAVAPRGWGEAHERFFADGAVFDRIYQPLKKQ